MPTKDPPTPSRCRATRRNRRPLRSAASLEPNTNRLGPNTSRASSKNGRTSASDVFCGHTSITPAANLQYTLRRSAKGANRFCPIIAVACFQRFGQMIEHEKLLRVAIDKFDRVPQMPRQDQQVIRQIELFEQRDAAVEVGPEHVVVVGFALQHVTHAAKFWVRGKCRQPFLNVWRNKRQPADDAGDVSRPLQRVSAASAFRFQIAGPAR